MKMGTINLKLCLCVAIIVTAASPAFAANGDAWADPALEVIEVLESGLVKIGAMVIGIGIIAFGAWGALTARIEWSKFGFILIGGLLVVAGPTMIRTLLEVVGN
ncbi:MAG: TrbC/VirB2 family protein [Rhodospirillales bacterium]